MSNMKKGYMLLYMMIILFLLGISVFVLRNIFFSKQAMVDDFIEQDKQMIMQMTEK